MITTKATGGKTMPVSMTVTEPALVVWALLARIGKELPDGEARRAVAEAVGQVEPQEDEHIRWESKTWQEMAVTQARHP